MLHITTLVQVCVLEHNGTGFFQGFTSTSHPYPQVVYKIFVF